MTQRVLTAAIGEYPHTAALPEQIKPLSAQYRQVSATDPEKAKTLLDQINALQAQYQEARQTFEALKTSTGAAL